MNYQDIIKNAIDLHVHVGPEIIPRKFTLPELLNYEKGKLKGIGIKNHFFPTVAMNTAETFKSEVPFVINSVTLNHYVGGFNADIIRASAELSVRPIIVWFPTIHALNSLRQQTEEIPAEWLGKQAKKIKLRGATAVGGLTVLEGDGQLKPAVVAVLKTIKECDAVLATGHLSWQESRVLVMYAAQELDIKRIIVTHPIYQKIQMPLDVQKELAALGAYLEHCFSMHSIDKIPVAHIAEQIKELGARNCIISSDVGQAFSKSPSEALAVFLMLLEKQGITRQAMKVMLVDNPSALVS